MSEAGRLFRGEKWNACRDSNGNLFEGIKNDPNKMADVEYFLESKPQAQKEKPKKGKK